MAQIPTGVSSTAARIQHQERFADGTPTVRRAQAGCAEQLLETVARLAGPAESQVSYLRRLGSGGCADELALEFSDVAAAATSNDEALSEPQRLAVQELDQKLEEMSGPDQRGLWTAETLASAKEWRGVSDLAQRSLVMLRGAGR